MRIGWRIARQRGIREESLYSFTGRRVPLNTATHRLTFPGMRPTVGHCFQSSIVGAWPFLFSGKGNGPTECPLPLWHEVALMTCLATDRRDASGRQRHETGQMLLDSGEDQTAPARSAGLVTAVNPSTNARSERALASACENLRELRPCFDKKVIRATCETQSNFERR
jgi:hypothetical protein